MSPASCFVFVDFLCNVYTPFHERIKFQHSAFLWYGMLLLCRVKTDYQEEVEALKRTQKLGQVNSNTSVKAVKARVT